MSTAKTRKASSQTEAKRLLAAAIKANAAAQALATKADREAKDAVAKAVADATQRLTVSSDRVRAICRQVTGVATQEGQRLEDDVLAAINFTARKVEKEQHARVQRAQESAEEYRRCVVAMEKDEHRKDAAHKGKLAEKEAQIQELTKEKETLFGVVEGMNRRIKSLIEARKNMEGLS